MKRLKKLITMIMVAVMTISNVPIAVLAVEENLNVGVKSHVEYGDLDAEGHVYIKKSAVLSGEGKYKITFEIQGVPVTHTSPLYAAVVFDRSGSMICNPSKGYADLKSTNPHFTAADGTGIVCKNDSNGRENSSLLVPDKWNNAISGAQSFQMSLQNALGNDAHISLIAFASSPATATSDFSDSSFGHPYGATNLSEAITAAKNKLDNDSRNVPNAKKVILVISDGEPTEPSGLFTDPRTAAQDAASSAKNSDIEIYVVGYETDETTSKYLKEKISSYDSAAENDKHYSDADTSTVSEAVNNMVNELLAAGTNVSLQDTVTANFTINGQNFSGGTETFSLNNITDTKQIIEFYVDIDKKLPTGVYDTNNTTDNKAVLEYYDPTGEKKQIILDESPSVYWEKPKYNYVVKYYKDEVNDNNFLGQTDSKEADYLSTVVNEVNVDLKKPVNGYNSGIIQNPELTISEDEAQNIINVVYNKKNNLIYKVNYNYAEITGLPSLSHFEIVENQVFGTVITHSDIEALANTDLANHPGYVISSINPTGDLTIADESQESELSNNIITINYVPRTDLSYVVKHNYENHEELNSEDSPVLNQTYGDEITDITKKELSGFYYETHTPNPLKVGVGENIINVYYKLLHNLTYTVEYYQDDELKETETSEAIYSIDDVINNATIESLVTNGASKFEGYKYDHSNVEELPINADVTKNVIKLYYIKRNDIKYRIEYYYDDEIDGTLTEKLEGTYLEEISGYTDNLKEGYMFARTQNMPLTLTSNEDSNVIKVYYVTDSKGTAIEIPNTGIKSTNDSNELIQLFFLLSMAYFLRNRKVFE